MSPQVAILLEDIKDETLAEALIQRGWMVHKKNIYQWETPTSFNKRHGHCKSWLSKVLWRVKHKLAAPIPDFEARVGKQGRITLMRSNPELESFANSPHEYYNPIPQAKHSGVKSPATPSRPRSQKQVLHGTV